MAKVQNTIDGYTVNFHRARMSGTFDLEADDAERFATDEVIVGVFVGQVEGPNIKVDRKTGDITRTNVVKVSEVRALTGPLKKVLVEQLGLVGPDTTEVTVKTVPAPAAAAAVTQTLQEDAEEDGAADSSAAQPEVFDEDSLEADEDEEDEDTSEAVWEPTVVENLGRVGRQSFQEPEQQAASGPRTLPFVDRDGVGSVTDREVVGRIVSKDKVLAKAMSSDGWR